ncbi:AN1-type zinc finger protein 5-like [Grus japonensis]|uniref:AN1-type zinc finger protein 5-like n=1 Tax=Grus japonensis TaxID=30415 RepID=A0ABC9XFQ1_GRUJA
MRRDQELPLCRTEPLPAGSKTDPLLAKAEPTSNTSGALVTRPEEKEGEEVFQVLEQIPLQPMEKTMVRQAVHLQPMEVHGGADIHLQPVEDPMPEQVDVPEGSCDPVESPHWSRLLAGPAAMGDPRWSSPFLKERQNKADRNPQSPSPCTTQREEREELGMKE